MPFIQVKISGVQNQPTRPPSYTNTPHPQATHPANKANKALNLAGSNIAYPTKVMQGFFISPQRPNISQRPSRKKRAKFIKAMVLFSITAKEAGPHNCLVSKTLADGVYGLV